MGKGKSEIQDQVGFVDNEIPQEARKFLVRVETLCDVIRSRSDKGLSPGITDEIDKVANQAHTALSRGRF